jgi:hypothetical protein
VNGGPYTPLELVHQGGFDYLAEIPGQPYVSAVEYYVRAEDSLGFVSLDPPGAPAVAHIFYVAPLEVLLDDPFEEPNGWTAGVPGDDATTGIWVREEPVGSWSGPDPVQPEYDHTPDPGEICFVTGNALPGQSSGTNDVDNGKTTLLSPVFDMEGFTVATLTYWVWYSNDTGSSPDDTWLVQVTSDGLGWTDLENTTQSTNAWVERSFELEDYVEFTSQVQIRFVASDYGYGSIVEAAVDDFVLSGMATTTGAVPEIAPIMSTALDPCRPNPWNPFTTIDFRLGVGGEARLRIFDVSGRLVTTLVDAELPAGAHQVRWDGRNQAGQAVVSGIYFMRLDAPGFMQVRQMAVVR